MICNRRKYCSVFTIMGEDGPVIQFSRLISREYNNNNIRSHRRFPAKFAVNDVYDKVNNQ